MNNELSLIYSILGASGLNQLLEYEIDKTNPGLIIIHNNL